MTTVEAISARRTDEVHRTARALFHGTSSVTCLAMELLVTSALKRFADV